MVALSKLGGALPTTHRLVSTFHPPPLTWPIVFLVQSKSKKAGRGQRHLVRSPCTDVVPDCQTPACQAQGRARHTPQKSFSTLNSPRKGALVYPTFGGHPRHRDDRRMDVRLDSRHCPIRHCNAWYYYIIINYYNVITINMISIIIDQINQSIKLTTNIIN